MGFSMQPYGVQSMLKEGHKHLSGLDEAVLKNIDACKQLSAITRTSLGPNGMNKMVINHLDKLFVTSDAGTIVNELEVQHPAAKILVLAGKAQQEEIGDGVNLTISFAGELLQNAEELIRMGLHPSEIISGYTKGIKKSIELLGELVEEGSDNMDVRNKEQVFCRMRAAVASKQFGQEEQLCLLIADACIQVCPKNPANFNVDNVRVAKLLGGGLHNSSVVRGMVLKNDAVGSIKRMEKAKVAVFVGGVDTSATETKGTVLIHSAEQVTLSISVITYISNRHIKMEVPHFVFGIFGNATALFLFLAPLITFKRILKSRSTEDFSGIPYVMTLLNCLLSAWYGLPFVSPNNLLVSTINGTGAGIESIYVLLFLVYAPRREKAKILGLLTFVIAMFSVVAFVSLFGLQGKSRKLFCGFAASIFSIIMYGSPLSIMRLVIKTKSVEYMPFFLSLFVFLCGTSWFVFGLLGHDPFVAVPNGFGCGLGAVQLILYTIYRNHKGDPSKTAANDATPEKATSAENPAQATELKLVQHHEDSQV